MTGQTAGTFRQLTGPGRSAIATIEVTGDLARLDAPSAIFRARSGRAISELAVNALCFGVWGDPGEDVVVCRTGESSLEITCHGGLAAVSRILDDVASRNFVLKSGGCEPTEASSVIEVPATQSASHAGLVVNDIHGRSGALSGLRLPLSVLRTARTQRVAEILLEQTSIDWENVALEMDKSSREVATKQAETALSWAEFGRHLVEPWDVVLCGRPNVGKSSLMNALAGFTRSIVSEQAGTTRDRVTLETAIQCWPVRITDTAGVRDANDAIEKEGISQTLAAMDRADLVVVVSRWQ